MPVPHQCAATLPNMATGNRSRLYEITPLRRGHACGLVLAPKFKARRWKRELCRSNFVASCMASLGPINFCQRQLSPAGCPNLFVGAVSTPWWAPNCAALCRVSRAARSNLRRARAPRSVQRFGATHNVRNKCRVVLRQVGVVLFASCVAPGYEARVTSPVVLRVVPRCAGCVARVGAPGRVVVYASCAPPHCASQHGQVCAMHHAKLHHIMLPSHHAGPCVFPRVGPSRHGEQAAVRAELPHSSVDAAERK
jgi:hypothetical protein